MKISLLPLGLALAAGTCTTAQAQIKLNSGMLGTGLNAAKAAKAATIIDQEVIDYTKEYVA